MPEGDDYLNYKNRKFVKAMGTFLGIALFFTFFSKTIYNFNLPTVTVTAPASGKLVDILEKSAMITPSDSRNIYAKRNGKIKDVLVSAGQSVKKGQKLMILELDKELIEQSTLDVRLKEQDIELLTINLNNIRTDIRKIESDLDSLEKGSYAGREDTGYELDIRNAEKTLEDKQVLFEVGAVSRSEVDEAAGNLEVARLKYKQYILAEKEKTMELLKTKQENMNDLSFQIKKAQLELDTLKKKLAQAQNGNITAESDGIIMNIKVEEGVLIVQNDILLQITALSDIWKAEFTIDKEKLDLFDAQSGVEVTIKSVPGILTGKITSITPDVSENGEESKVTIIIRNAKQDLAGKSAVIKIKTERGPYPSVIPNYALRKDENGYYILVLQEENSVLGKNLIAHKVSIDLLDTDGFLSAIEGLILSEPVVTASTSPIKDGSRVKYNGTGEKDET